MTRFGLDLFQDVNLLPYLQQQQQANFEIAPEQLPQSVAKIVREHKAEFGDTIDSEAELRQLMKLLDQTGGGANGLPRPDFGNLNGMSLQDMLQVLVDWLMNGGANRNQPGRNLGNLGGGGGGGGNTGATTPTGGTTNNGVQGPAALESPGSLPGPESAQGSTRLAEAGRTAAMGMGGYNSQGLCATGVSRAIQAAYGISVSGNGNQIDDNLPKSKFRQVNMSLEEALKIPGLVLTWESTSSSAGSIYGHTAITSGDGRSSFSDFIENNTLAAEAGRRGLKIFMPIS